MAGKDRKKPASRSGHAGGDNKKRAQKRYRYRLSKKIVKEVSVQWESSAQADAERQLQLWQLAQKAKALEEGSVAAV